MKARRKEQTKGKCNRAKAGADQNGVIGACPLGQPDDEETTCNQPYGEHEHQQVRVKVIPAHRLLHVDVPDESKFGGGRHDQPAGKAADPDEWILE